MKSGSVALLTNSLYTSGQSRIFLQVPDLKSGLTHVIFNWVLDDDAIDFGVNHTHTHNNHYKVNGKLVILLLTHTS